MMQKIEDKKLWKDKRHHHFWIEDGELYESYRTIRGLRFRHRLTVHGMKDCDNCPEEMIIYIEKEYL